MTRGYDFQEMVTLIEILRLGASILEVTEPDGTERQVHVRQDGPVGVDDLVIVTPWQRRHIQIKSGAEPYWVERLVSAVWSDYFEYRDDTHRRLLLQICVGSEAAERKLEANKKSHDLDYVGVEIFHENVENLAEPFRDDKIYELMSFFSHVPEHALLHHTMWSDMCGAWKRVGRKAKVTEIFDAISLLSRHTTKTLALPTTDQMELVDQLNKNIEELWFSADGDKLVVTDLYGKAMLPQSSGFRWEVILTTFTGEIPKTLDEFEGALRSLKRRSWTDE